MITAGHCFPKNATVQNGKPSHSGTRHTMGTVSTTGSFGKTDGIDAEMINTTSHGRSSKAIYTGSSTSPQVDDVSGSATSPAGTQVCDSGAFEGEICDLVIQKTSPMPFCITEKEGKKEFVQCDMYLAEQPQGKIAVGNGDSGGPVFRFYGGELHATGIVTAGGGAAVKCPTQQYPHVLKTRYCYPDLFYTSISSILSEFKVTLNT